MRTRAVLPDLPRRKGRWGISWVLIGRWWLRLGVGEVGSERRLLREGGARGSLLGRQVRRSVVPLLCRRQVISRRSPCRRPVVRARQCLLVTSRWARCGSRCRSRRIRWLCRWRRRQGWGQSSGGTLPVVTWPRLGRSLARWGWTPLVSLSCIRGVPLRMRLGLQCFSPGPSPLSLAHTSDRTT
jgi:hypothetical protein